MNFLSGLAKGGDSNKSGDEKSTTDLFASARVVAEAAQAQYSNQPDKYDKGKAAGAAADLLDAASDYGKLDQTQGVGKYVDQAETYLRQYGTPQSAAAPSPASGEEKPAPTATETSAPEIPSGGDAGEYVKKAEEFVSKPSEVGDEAGDAGEYVKKAEEFVSKPSEIGDEAGGAGEYVKKAEEFVSKPSEIGDEAGEAGAYVKKAEAFLSKPSEIGDEAGGAGEYVKKAEEFLSKPSEDGVEAGSAGDYIKKAEEFLGKPSDGGEKGESEGGYGGALKAAGGFFK